MQSASWKFSDLNPRLSGDLFLYFQKATESLHIYSKINSYLQGITHAALSHEFTHFVEELSAEKFRKFTDVLFDVLGKSDVDVNRLIEAKEAVLRNTEEYKGRSEKELRAIAYSEAVAEMMEPVLTDTDAISRISQKIKQQDRSLWEKIKDFIKGIVEKLKAAYRDMEPDSAIARLTRETVTNSEAVLEAFSEAAADAVLNYNLQEGQKNNAREGGRFSIRKTQKMSWDEQIMGALYGKGSIARNDTLVAGQISTSLAQEGIEQLPLAIPRSVLTKASDGRDISHSIKKGKLAKLNVGIKNSPITIVNPARNAIVFITDIKQGGAPVLVAFDRNTLFDGDKVHKATSIHLQMNVQAMLENLPASATVYVKNRNELAAVGATDNLRGLAANVKLTSGDIVTEAGAEVKGNFLKSSRDTSEMTYAEILAEQTALRARQEQVKAKKNEAMNNPELLSAMDSYTEMFNELWNLLGKKHRGEASAADIERISDIKSRRDETQKKIAEIQDEIGLNGITEEEAELRSMETTLRKAADSAWAREGAQKENKAIEKSGLSAPEYFRRKALRAFKTTRNFNEAGYLLPDGKMLDFSGGERNHRYRDHREIGEIYEATQGANALNRFLNDGNIRIMAESPGVDISANGEPTAEQYAAIRKFVMSHGTDKGQFFVDFSNSDGHNVGNYSYNRNVSPERVLNDIKYFYENGETRKQSEVAEFLYSSRDSEYLNLAQNPEENREALSRMVENAAREAGYDSPVLYHGTQSFGFTNFDLDKMDDKLSIFLTSNPDIAATYSGVDGNRNIGKASGTDINTLSLQEVAQMLNQFPPESGMDYQYSVVESKAEISGQVDRGLNELNNLINTLKKQYGKDSKEYGRLEKLQNTLYLGTNDGLSTQLWMILKRTDLFKGHEDFVNGLEQNLRLLKKAPESGSFLVEKALGGYSIDVLSEADAKEELSQNMQRGNYALYARLGNTLTVEGEGQRWNNLKNWSKGMEVDENSTYVMEDDGKFFLLRKADDSVVENGVIEATEKARELSPDALQFLLIQKANTSLRILTEVATTTRDVTKWAKNAGYDSVIFKNIKDSGGQNNSVSMDTTADIYAIFNPNNAKSADAVTYDDNGNVIPLSQRFDTGKEDIRYSARYAAAEENPEIANLVQRVLSGDFKANDKVYLGTVSQKNAARIQEITGINVDGFRVAIEARQIEHILNRHGIEGSADHSMAQVSDISKIGYILSDPDNISPAGKTQAYTYMRNGKNRTADTVIYEKGIGEKTYYAVQAVPDTKAKTLYIVTAFIQKNSKGASQLIGANGSNVNVRDGSVVTPTGNVAQTGTNVKGKNLESRRVSQEVRDAIEEYRRQQDVQSKAYRQMYERQLEEVKKSYQKQISSMESEYSANLAQIQDAFFQTVEAYEKGQFRNEHLEKVLKQAAEAQRAQAKARVEAEQVAGIRGTENILQLTEEQYVFENGELGKKSCLRLLAELRGAALYFTCLRWTGLPPAHWGRRSRSCRRAWAVPYYPPER